MARKRMGERREYHLYLPVAMYEELNRNADERGLSMNAVIVELLKKSLGKRSAS